MSRYQRTHDGAEQKTTTLELFYDLVFVFAITQVSHLRPASRKGIAPSSFTTPSVLVFIITLEVMILV